MATNTFLFTDIESSTRLWEAHHDEMRDALEAHDGLINAVVAANDGKVFKHTGDGAVAVFDSAVSALQAAVDIQRRLRSQDHPAIGPLNVRIGVHSGEATERDGDFFGPTLNRAARLTAAAHGGQILVSMVTEALVEGEGLEFVDLGEHRLHDLGRAEHIFQLVDPALPREFAPVRTLDYAPNNLPTQATSFVGRERELEALIGHLGSSRLVTLTGVGGAGKTRLALQAAAAVVPEFPDGVWLVELGAVTDAEKVEVSFLEALGLNQPTDASPRAAVLDHLADRSLLLVVDNCEHLIDTVAEEVDAIMAHAPGCSILATSRELLGVPGEVAFGLRSMRLPRDGTRVDDITQYDGLALFAERAQAAVPGFTIDEANLGVILEICRRLDGMPLAMELAAARLRSFSPAKIAELLDRRFRLLTGGSRTALPRQQTLAATIDWSYRLLEEREQVVFRRLAVFQGGFTLAAASEICVDGAIDDLDILEVIPALVDKSLVVTDQAVTDRYRLLETIRQFARDRMDDDGEGERLRERHASYFHDFVVDAEKTIVGPDEVETRLAVRAEYDNLRSAVSWALERGRGNLALATAFGFGRFAWIEGRWSEALALVDRAIAIADPPATALEEADRLLRRATLASSSRDVDTALAEMERAEEILLSLTDGGSGGNSEALELLGRTINARAIVLFYRGEGGERNEHFIALDERALQAARLAGDDYMAALLLANLAHHRDPFGDPELARRRFAEAEALTEKVGSIARKAGLASQRAFFEFSVEDYDASLEAWDKAIALAAEAGLETQLLEYRVARSIAELAAGRDDAAKGLRTTMRELTNVPDFLSGRQFGFIQTTLVAAAAADAADGRPDLVAVAAGASTVVAGEGTPVKWDLVPYWNRLVDSARAGLGQDFERYEAQGRKLDRAGIVEFLTER